MVPMSGSLNWTSRKLEASPAFTDPVDTRPFGTGEDLSVTRQRPRNLAGAIGGAGV